MTGKRKSFQKQRGRTGRWLILCAVVLAAGCSERGPAEPTADPDQQPAPAGLSVSEPAGGPGALAAGEEGVVYVSASPGTFLGGLSATVTNSSTDESVTAEIIEGGFDPVAIGGSPGDALEIRVRYRDGSSVTYLSSVPVRKRPRVVRTRPPKDAVDIRLNTSALVVFSEPIDPSTVTPRTVQFLRDGEPVAVSLTLDETGLQLELVPDQLLEPETTYTLTVTTEVLDLTGDALEEAVTSSFTTEAAPTDEILVLSSSANPETNPEGPKSGEIYVVGADGLWRRRLTHYPGLDYSPSPSPDGTRVLFFRDPDGPWEIYVVNTDGTNLINLTNTPSVNEAYATWSPDGMKIAYASWRFSASDVFVVNVDGSNRINLTNTPTAVETYPAWSPDGTKIAFVTEQERCSSGCSAGGEILVMNTDGSNRVNLTNTPSVKERNPTWSPDGTKLAYLSDADRRGICSWPFDLFVMNADGSNPVNLTGEPGNSCAAGAVDLAWSPDGTKIAFQSDYLNIWSVDPDGSNKINLTNDSWTWTGPPHWSPDGSRIAFGVRLYRTCATCSTPYQDYEVFVMNADGSSPVRLYNGPNFSDFVHGWR